MKRISVIVLSYNNLLLLSEALDSLLMQDYPEFELLVFDDGSRDFCVSEIEAYIKKNAKENCKRVVVYTNERNLGTIRNLNKAIAYSKGEYIVPMAADDVLYDCEVLSRFANAFELHQDALVLTSQVAQYDEKLEQFLCHTLTENHIKLLRNCNFSEIYGELCLHSFLPAGGTVYRKGIFEQYGLFDEDYRLVEDWPFSLKMTRLGVPFCYCDFISLKHRNGGVSRSPLKNSTQKLYQTDLVLVMKQEILPHLSVAPSAMKERILTQCADKMLLYSLRYEFPQKKLSEKCRWLLTTKSLLPALRRRVERRMFKHE